LSRNKDRTNITEPFIPEDSSPSPAAITPPGSEESSGFNWTTPTEFVKLPSGGNFYPADHPLHQQDVVEIRYMTAKEEDILTSQALLKQGIAVDRALQNMLVDKTINVNSLLIGDKNALVVGARITGYGADYNVSVTCPSCQEVNETTFDLQDPSYTNFEEGLASEDVTLTDNNTFLFTLPLTKAQIECRLLTGADEIESYKRLTKNKRNASLLTDQFRTMIVSVNGDANPLTKEQFIQSMPARDSRYLRSAYGSVVPNIDLTQNFECTSCGYSADMEVPLTADFFWPKQ
jgi:hypothetical protein